MGMTVGNKYIYIYTQFIIINYKQPNRFLWCVNVRLSEHGGMLPPKYVH